MSDASAAARQPAIDVELTLVLGALPRHESIAGSVLLGWKVVLDAG
jgi:hypothetical protein